MSTEDSAKENVNKQHPQSFEVGKLNFTKHENKNIIEVVINGILIAKNKDDDLINISQILTLAGLSEEETEKLLGTDEEITNERTEIDDGKYKGIWIKTGNAVALSKKFGVEEPLQSLIKEHDDVIQKPSLTRSYSTMTDMDNEKELAKETSKESTGSPSKKLKTGDSDKSQKKPITESAEPPIDISNIADYEQAKKLMSQVFLSEGEAVTEACNQLASSHQIDLPIDVHNNTVLHWATSLANVGLIFQLVELGSNSKRGNNDGETALMKAVSHVNFFDNLMFGKLLDILYPSITVLDKKNRTLLHHIVLLAGSDGRSDASKYYLQCLVEWIIKNSPNRKDAITLSSFMNEIVNLKDSNGDTALNIVARIGNKAIAQQLLDVGADPKIPNKAGLTPADFRLTGLNMSNSSLAKTTGLVAKASGKHSDQLGSFLHRNGPSAVGSLVNEENGTANIETNKKISQESKKILTSMQDMMGQLDNFFETELKAKQTEINQLYKELKQSTIKLSQSRGQLEMLKNSESKLNELKQKTSNIEKSMKEEQVNFEEQYPEATSAAPDATYDPDQPFKFPEVYEIVKSKLERDGPSATVNISSEAINLENVPPMYVLKARIKAYVENEKYLSSLASGLNEKSMVLENKFRHVVSLCTGVEESKVDDLLEGLVQAVESDPDEVDIGRVSGFLTKVDEDI
ncbi:transcriptional regulator [Saccharomycopsis crataegensis]|uniref:Transcriptional regulator n=1 Tax=Saccharomycopsis crataegensis TaxID=43959 RepID=A0AAV5QMV9_9ASCO|nr:transcriptional regulator [Saccharomycopsis crataegensis]